MTSAIDPLRHMSIFSPDKFGGRTVDVIGAGATGSHVAYFVAKLGVKNIRAWDPDKLELHNIANQLFRISDVGRPKVDALTDVIKDASGVKIDARPEYVTRDTRELDGEVVFLLTDTMKSRREIAEGCLFFNPAIKLVVETRMSAGMGMVYSFNPCDPSHQRQWLSTLVDDKDTVETECGAAITVGTTAAVVGGVAVWQMIKWFNYSIGTKDAEQIDNEIIVTMMPMMLRARKFKF